MRAVLAGYAAEPASRSASGLAVASHSPPPTSPSTPYTHSDTAWRALSGVMVVEKVNSSDDRSRGTTSPGVTLADTSVSSAAGPNSSAQPPRPRSRALTTRPPATATRRAEPPLAPATWCISFGASRLLRSTTATPASPTAT
jgi:hypothetical protein